MKWLKFCVVFALFSSRLAVAGNFAPAAGTAGSDAVPAGSSAFKEWATSFSNLIHGRQDISSSTNLAFATFGSGSLALGPSDCTTSVTTNIVSLGNGGQITLSFAKPITNGPGADLAVFENGFADTFLELAFVEVSTNGVDFARFPSISDTQVTSQVSSTLDPTNLYDLAGKYRAGFGTPFNLDEIVGLSPMVDANNINYVRIIDVVGSINPTYATYDSAGHIINAPFPMAFASSGFDLDAVGVLNTVPEPGSFALAGIGATCLAGWSVRRRSIARHAQRRVLP